LPHRQRTDTLMDGSPSFGAFSNRSSKLGGSCIAGGDLKPEFFGLCV
jgi:hypothetical protein